MQTYHADLECIEPVANGFHCEALDSVSFSYIGEHLTKDKVRKVLTEQGKKCWKCLRNNWMIRQIVPVSYCASAEATRY